MQFLKQNEVNPSKNYYWHRTKDGTIYATSGKIDSDNLPGFFFNGEGGIVLTNFSSPNFFD